MIPKQLTSPQVKSLWDVVEQKTLLQFPQVPSIQFPCSSLFDKSLSNLIMTWNSAATL